MGHAALGRMAASLCCKATRRQMIVYDGSAAQDAIRAMSAAGLNLIWRR